MRSNRLILALILSMSAVACGGGGGGGSSDGGDNDDDGGSTVQTESATVSGVVNKDTGTTTSTAAVQAAQGEVNARVLITSHAGSGNEVDTVSTVANDDFTDDEVFSAQVELAEDGGYVVIEVEEEGFTSYTKRVDFDSPSDIDIQAELREVTRLTAMPGTTIAHDGESISAYQFAIMRAPDGTTTAVAGSDAIQIAKASNHDTELEITVPADSAGVDASEEMTAELSNFDPSDPDDARNFPGRYADSEGNRLVSVAFDFAGLSQEGENLGERAANDSSTSTASSHSTTIERAIPTGSCEVLASQQDYDDSTTGFQVPVYTNNPNTGDWDMLGVGTVRDSTETPIAEDGFVQSDCETNGHSLVVEVTNEDFLRKWWNLDYPLTFDEPEEYCANVRVENQAGDPITGTALSFQDDDGRSFQETYAYTNASGEAAIDTVRLDGSADTTGVLRFWGYNSGVYESESVTLTEKSNGSCGAMTQVVEVDRADTCTVTGRVMDDAGNVRPDTVVWASSNSQSLFHFATGYTNDQGNYSLNVVCGTDYMLWAGYNTLGGATASFNVNDTVEGQEESDAGDTVGLPDLTVTNYGPWLYAIAADTPVSTGETVRMNVLGFDFEGDYPVDYEFSFPDGSCQSSGQEGNDSCTGTITQEQMNAGDEVVEFWQFNQSSGQSCYTIGTMTGTDSEGNSQLFGYAIAAVDPDPTCGF
ncbi:hypothetical protein H0Z60_01160 [Ectothiorhodospiraceae bacterium WFHF3C12]|nr:hypothetical protein [Ectothiorhodospiraceae bacterium WFHF3C12]